MKYPQATLSHHFADINKMVNHQENNLIPISDKINSSNYLELTTVNKSLSPNWEILSVEKAQQAIVAQTNPTETDNLEEAKLAIQRRSHAVLWNLLISERGRSIIVKAAEYQIPYDEEFDSLTKLLFQIDDYEQLLEEAKNYNINWDISEYDPIGLEDAVFEAEQAEKQGVYDQHMDYLESRI